MRWLLSAGLVLLLQGMAWGQAMKIYDNIYEQKDAAIATPATWQALVYNGTKWANIALRSEGTFTVAGTTGTPTSWNDGVTVYREGVNLTATGYALLPAANTFPPGTEIIYIDDVVTGNFGRVFRRKGTDTLNGGTADVAPFIAGGRVGGRKVARFVTNGASAWRRVDDGMSVAQIQDSSDASKIGTFNTSLIPPNTTVPMTWPAEPWVGVIPGDVDAGLFLKGYNTNGTASAAAVIATDIIPTQFTVGAIEVAAGTIHTVTDTDPGTIDTVKLAAPITVPHTFVFPDAAHYATGATIRFFSSVDTLGVAAHVSSTSDNTFNGKADIDITEAYFNRVFVANPDPVAPELPGWTVSTFGGGTGTGLKIKPFTAIPRVGSTATLVCDPDLPFENNTLDLTTASTALAINGATTGKHGVIRVKQDSVGSRTLTFSPVGTFKTQSGGAGVVTLSSSINAEDEIAWDFDGVAYNVSVRGLGYTAQPPPLYVTAADTGGTASSNFQSLGGDAAVAPAPDNFNFGLAGEFTAVGGTGVVTGDTYTIGKLEVWMKKAGAPTFNIKAQIYDKGVGGLPTTPVANSTASVINAGDSSITTTDGPITFTGITAQLTAGTNYFVVLTKSDVPVPASSATDYLQIAYQSTPAHPMFRKAASGGGSWTNTGSSRWLRFKTYK